MSEADRVLATRSELLHRLNALLGGRGAEEMILGEASTEAHDDLAAGRPTGEADGRRLGMSDGLWPLALPDLSDGPGAPWSERTLNALDVETRRIVDEAAASAVEVLRTNRAVLEAMMAALVEVENLEGEALDRLFADWAQPDRPVIALVAS